MKNFPTSRTILKAIESHAGGLTLTEIIDRTHPSFNYLEYRKDGHRAMIRENLVKTGKVKEVKFNKRTYKYVATRQTKRQRFLNIIKKVRF